jgi:hypothetical protein
MVPTELYRFTTLDGLQVVGVIIEGTKTYLDIGIIRDHQDPHPFGHLPLFFEHQLYMSIAGLAMMSYLLHCRDFKGRSGEGEFTDILQGVAHLFPLPK